MLRTRSLIRFQMLFSLIACASAAHSADSNFSVVMIDGPNGANTFNAKINDVGGVAATFLDSDGLSHGLLVSAGQPTVIDIPGAVSIDVAGINNRGAIIGTYSDGTLTPPPVERTVFKGFVWHQGVLTTIEFPGASRTFLTGLNDHGRIVGNYNTLTGPTFGRGFVYANGTYTSIATPNGDAASRAASINNLGQTVGWYEDLSQPGNTAFIYSPSGTLTSFRAPKNLSTNAVANNNVGLTIGTYVDSVNTGFLYDGRKLSKIAVPNATDTQLIDINDAGDFVGVYSDVDSVQHSFYGRKGRIKDFSLGLPDASDTQVTAINNSGQIAGCFNDVAESRSRCFVATPK